MNEQHVTISPEAQELIKRMRGDTGLGLAVCRLMDLENELTVGHIQKDYLSARGPMTLGVVTYRLRGSIRPSRSYPDGQGARSSIGSNVVYAGPHEFGFDGTVQVPAHKRSNRSFGDKYGVNGETVNYATALRMGVLTKSQASQAAKASGKYTFAKRGAKQTAVGGEVTVKAHKMHMKVKARHYVFNGIKDRLQAYGNALSRAIVGFWNKRNGAS